MDRNVSGRGLYEAFIRLYLITRLITARGNTLFASIENPNVEEGQVAILRNVDHMMSPSVSVGGQITIQQMSI